MMVLYDVYIRKEKNLDNIAFLKVRFVSKDSVCLLRSFI